MPAVGVQSSRRCSTARLGRTARRTIMRIAHHLPWAAELATAYTRLAALPQPIG
jgi:hypothetical protein